MQNKSATLIHDVMTHSTVKASLMRVKCWNFTCMLHDKIPKFKVNDTDATETQESLTLQNIQASCLSSPSGQGAKPACSQTHPYKHPPLAHPLSVSKPADTTLEDHPSRCALTLPSCPAEETSEGISRLTGCLLTQQHALECKSPVTDGGASSAWVEGDESIL